MLVVTANWAFTDGTLVPQPRRRQMEWLEAVHRAAVRAGGRRDGRYEPVDRVDIVLAGDTLDPLTSTAWLGGLRPWQAGRRAGDAAAAVMVAATARCRPLVAALGRWARRGLPLPAADRRGLPDSGRELRVPCRVTLLPGPRDRWIAAAAARLARHGVTVAGSWSANGITVRPGAELDPLWSAAGEPGRLTLGESIAVDLVARFGALVRDRVAAWPAGGSLVAALAAARPIDLPLVVTEAVARAEPASSAALVLESWRSAVATWRRQARLAGPDCNAGIDGVAAVAAWMATAGDRRPAAPTAEVAALLEPVRRPAERSGETAVIGHLAASETGPSLVGLGPPPWRASRAEPPAGVAVTCVAPTAGPAGPGGVVFPDGRPGAWQWLAPDGEPPRQSAPARCSPAAHRIVEAA